MSTPEIAARLTRLETEVTHLKQQLHRRSLRPAFGFMQGQGEILGDIITPIEQPWEVLQ